MRIGRKVRLRSPAWEITTVKISVVRIAGLPIARMPTLKFKAKSSFHQDFLAQRRRSNYQSSIQTRQSNSLSFPRSASLSAERPHCKDARCLAFHCRLQESRRGSWGGIFGIPHLRSAPRVVFYMKIEYTFK